MFPSLVNTAFEFFTSMNRCIFAMHPSNIDIVKISYYSWEDWSKDFVAQSMHVFSEACSTMFSGTYSQERICYRIVANGSDLNSVYCKL